MVVGNYTNEYGHLNGKRLLLLGGMRMACDIVRRAQSMGVYVVVADMTKDSPAKKIADKAIDEDVCNVDNIVRICKEEKIDGITTGFVDILLQPCHDACERLGLPYYANNLLIKMSTDKNAYKEYCSMFDIPVPKDYEGIDFDSPEEIDKICYPVFIKPADNSGSRGAFVCHSAAEFKENYPKALAFSPSKRVIVEQFLTGQDIILDYLIKDGEAHLLSMFDRKICAGRRIAINHANLLLAPSTSAGLFVEKIDANIKKMCRTLGFNDGLIFFQGYSNNGNITLFEMGCRLGGTFSNIDEYFLNVNPVDALIHYALTGKMADYADYSKITPFFDGAGCVLNLLLDEDAFELYKISGMDTIRDMKEVLNVIQFYQEGDKIPHSNATDKPFAILYIAADSSEGLRSVINTIYKTISVTDHTGKSLLSPVYNL